MFFPYETMGQELQPFTSPAERGSFPKQDESSCLKPQRIEQPPKKIILIKVLFSIGQRIFSIANIHLLIYQHCSLFFFEENRHYVASSFKK